MKGDNYKTTHVIPLPLINLDPGNLSTKNKALMHAVKATQSQKQYHSVVTFDQPLYMKAVEIVAAAGKETDELLFI